MHDAKPFCTLAAALTFAAAGWLASPARAGNLDDAWVYKESISALARAQNQWRYYPVSSNLVVCESLYTVGSNSREGCVARYLSQPWAPGVSPAGSLESRSPWWVDSNHNHVSTSPGQTGLGFINVIAQITPIQTNQAPLDLSGATVSFNAKKDALFDPLTATIRGSKSRKGHLYFWFQTASRALTGCTPNPEIGEDCTRQSDYILSDIEADPSGGSDTPYQVDSWLTPDVWRHLSYQFTPFAKWTCLGRGENVKYECAPIADALKNVTDFGFIVAPVCTAPLPTTPNPVYLCMANVQTAEANSNKGTIFLDDVTLSKPMQANVAWSRVVGITPVDPGNSVQKTAGGADWNAGAVSAQVIASGSGSVEFTVPDAAAYRVVGLTNGDRDQRPEGIDYAIYLDADGRLYNYESGVAAGYPAPNAYYAPGDRFRIAIDAGPNGPTITYFRNGVALPPRARPPGAPPVQYPLRVDSSILTPLATIGDVSLSGNPKDLARDVVWTAPRGALLITANTLAKPAAGGDPSGAISAESIAAGDGYVQFTAGETNTYKLLGLNNDDQSASYADIAYAIYLYAGRAEVFEKGVHKYDLPGAYAASDQFRVAVESNEGTAPVINYYRNYTDGSAPFYTSASTPVFPLFADASLYSTGATLPDVVLAGAVQQAAWSPTGSKGVTLSAGGVQKTAVTGWNAGSVSTQALLSGDGYVEFTTSENTLGKRIGLSRRAGHDYSDIDYQFSFPIIGLTDMAIERYESGTQVGPTRTFGPYAIGDRFRLGIEGGKLTYRRNGILLFQDPVALTDAAYPLMVNTSMYDTGSRFENTSIFGSLGSSGY